MKADLLVDGTLCIICESPVEMSEMTRWIAQITSEGVPCQPKLMVMPDAQRQVLHSVFFTDQQGVHVRMDRDTAKAAELAACQEYYKSNVPEPPR